MAHIQTHTEVIQNVMMYVVVSLIVTIHKLHICNSHSVPRLLPLTVKSYDEKGRYAIVYQQLTSSNRV